MKKFNLDCDSEKGLELFGDLLNGISGKKTVFVICCVFDLD